MNLRLPAEVADALRARAESTRRSQNDLVREALEQYLAVPLVDGAPSSAPMASLFARGLARPPQTPFRATPPTIRLPAGVTSLDLLRRDERL